MQSDSTAAASSHSAPSVLSVHSAGAGLSLADPELDYTVEFDADFASSPAMIDTPLSYDEAIRALNQVRTHLRVQQIKFAQAFQHKVNETHSPLNQEKKQKRENSINANQQNHTTQAHSHQGYHAGGAVHPCIQCLGLDGDGGEVKREVSFDEYLAMPITKILMKRMPWLVCLLIVQSFSATILHAFESLLDKHIVLAVFVPMLVGTGGNAGNQPGVMVTRALATGELNVRKLLLKEMTIAFFTASTLALIAFLRVWMEYPADEASAAVLALALFVGIFISIFLGIAFSIGLDRIRNCDPADGAAPLLTTISDLLGIALLCGIAEGVIG